MIDPRDREWIAQYLDETLSEEDFERFQQRLRDDAAVRERLRAALNLESGLLDWAAGDTRFAELWNGSPVQADTSESPVSPVWRWTWAGIALSVLCLIVGILWQASYRDGYAAPVAPTVPLSGGNVVLVDSDGKPRVVRSGVSVQPGDIIKTQGRDSFANLAFQDGTQVQIVGDTSVSLVSIRPIRLSVLSGMVSASVAKQEMGKPMVIVTPNDTIEVLGTEFDLEALPDRTDVRVNTGRVKLTRTIDGKSVLVSRGKRVVSDNFTPDLVVQQTHSIVDTWQQDFEKGLPDDWGQGELVTTGLPEGSAGAVRNVYFPRWDSHLIESPERWIEGLFVVRADTHIHFTFKMEQPDWINIFLQARGGDESDPTDLFQCNAAPFGRAKPGQWYTMSIPIHAWRRKDDVGDRGFVDPPPRPCEIVYVMSWSSRRVDRGLVIDRVWVTNTGSGKVEMKPLDVEE